MRRAFEQSYDVENGPLGWQEPVAGRRARRQRPAPTSTSRTSATTGIYGYAAPDPGQAPRSRVAFQVIDNDYAPDEFPDYTATRRSRCR